MLAVKLPRLSLAVVAPTVAAAAAVGFVTGDQTVATRRQNDADGAVTRPTLELAFAYAAHLDLAVTLFASDDISCVRRKAPAQWRCRVTQWDESGGQAILQYDVRAGKHCFQATRPPTDQGLDSHPLAPERVRGCIPSLLSGRGHRTFG
jgi:hypothetical protein